MMTEPNVKPEANPLKSQPAIGEWRVRKGSKATITHRIQDGPGPHGWHWGGRVDDMKGEWRRDGTCYGITDYDLIEPWVGATAVMSEITASGGGKSQPPAAPPLTIEPGEFQTRDGCKADIECAVKNGGWRGTIGGAGQIYWNVDGTYHSKEHPHAFDLIARWPQPAAEKEQIEVRDGDRVLFAGTIYPDPQKYCEPEDVLVNVAKPGDAAFTRSIPRSAIHSIIERAPVDPQPGDVVTWGHGTNECDVVALHGRWIVMSDPKWPDQAPGSYDIKELDGLRIVKRAGK